MWLSASLVYMILAESWSNCVSHKVYSIHGWLSGQLLDHSNGIYLREMMLTEVTMFDNQVSSFETRNHFLSPVSRY